LCRCTSLESIVLYIIGLDTFYGLARILNCIKVKYKKILSFTFYFLHELIWQEIKGQEIKDENKMWNAMKWDMKQERLIAQDIIWQEIRQKECYIKW
jgi:hypothetical protein